MRKFTMIMAAALLSVAAKAQTVADFESLPLTGTDTFYIDTTSWGNDVGFNSGNARFPCIYDTSGGYTLWNFFSYSNMTDSTTSGFGNQYAAKAYTGYGGSSKYAVAFCSDPLTYTPDMKLALTGPAIGKKVGGFYVTNSTYAYNSMRDGDFSAKKFGGATGTDPDWFLLTVKGYRSGALTADSVNFYLADFRSAISSDDYIVKTWEWVNLLTLGNVDSLHFHMSSSDNGGFGMNTPSYFCMDNLTTDEPVVGITAPASSIARIYPNPAHDMLYVDLNGNSVDHIAVLDMTGRQIAAYSVTGAQVAVNTAVLAAGTYVLQLTSGGRSVSAKFVKQ